MSRLSLEDKFADTSATISRLVEDISTGALALPEMQRPFVWSSTDVRDLFDSLYLGYPVGNVMVWRTSHSDGVRVIGTNTKQRKISNSLLIDGQQRTTSLFAVLNGGEVLDDSYQPKRIRLAFNPFTEKFAVANASTDNDAIWFSDITDLYTAKSARKVQQAFFNDIGSDKDVSEEQVDEAWDALDRVAGIASRSIPVVELSPDADVDDVAEIFIRTNSGGRKLSQGDFLLTLMSVSLSDERRQLEDWVRCVNSGEPFEDGPTPQNPLWTPSATHIVRITAGVAFRRGQLKEVRTMLAAKEVEDTEREERLDAWAQAQSEVLSAHNWGEFGTVMNAAGLLTSKMVRSQFALQMAYTLWLLGRRRSINRHVLDNLVARWLFMSLLKGRYSSSPESQFEADLYALARDGVDMVTAMERRLRVEMSHDYLLNITPDNLDTRTWGNRTLASYEAAQVIIGAQVLFAKNGMTVRQRLTPSTATVRKIERHHLFPKNYLSTLRNVTGHQLTSLANRPGNASLVNWIENNDISDEDPAIYWPEITKHLSAEVLEQQMRDHALYVGWWDDPYETFLERRRRMQAHVIKRGWETLVASRPAEVDIPDIPSEFDAVDEPIVPSVRSLHPQDVTMMTLLDEGLLIEGEQIVSTSPTYPGDGIANGDGTLTFDGVTYASPSGVAKALRHGQAANGWETLAVWRGDEQVTLHSLRLEAAGETVEEHEAA